MKTSTDNPPIRFPLQVGSTANYRVPSSAIGLVLGSALAFAPMTSTRSFDGYDFGAIVFGALFVIYGLIQAYGAIQMRASDLVIENRQLRIEGGPHGGTAVPSSELVPPFATVTSETERHLKLWRIFYYAVMALFLFLPLRFLPAVSLTAETKVWVLRLFRRRGAKGPYQGPKADGDDPSVVAKTERPIEAQSMEAAASSIVAMMEGREHVEQAPAIETELVSCPKCGAPAVLDDAERVPCRYCHASVPLADHVRTQAAANVALRATRIRSTQVVRTLLRQPQALRTNLSLFALWFIVFTSLPVSVGAAITYFSLADLRGPTGWARDVPWLLLLAPLVVMVASYVIGRARLVNRAAIQLLTLGFGALGPARRGDPSRCRRCHGPLPEVGMGGVAACGYCGADNIVGIDLRPFVDKARAEQQSFDDLLRERKRSKWRWATAALIAMAILSTTAGGIAQATARLVAFERDRRQACDAGVLEDCQWLYARYGVRSHLVRRCDDGQAEACLIAGDTYNGELWESRVDFPRAAELYDRACNGGAARGCFELGLLLDEGHAGAKDTGAAKAAYERGCAGADMDSCVNLAKRIADGEEGAGAAERVVALYERACEHDHRVGCYNLAVYHQHGEGTTRDFARAAELYGRACRLGYEKACEKQKKMERAVKLQDPEERRKFEERVRKRLEAKGLLP